MFCPSEAITVKAIEFKQMDPVALDEELDKHQRDLLNLRCQVALGEEVHPHQVRKLRKNIARIKTVKRELEMAGKESDA